MSSGCLWPTTGRRMTTARTRQPETGGRWSNQSASATASHRARRTCSVAPSPVANAATVHRLSFCRPALAIAGNVQNGQFPQADPVQRPQK